MNNTLTQLAQPKELFGYEILDGIGRGAGSTLYAVSHPDTHQLYAMKHVVPQTARDQRFVEQLENEYQIGRQVNHPGLRRAIDLKLNRSLLRKITEAALILDLFDGMPLDRISTLPIAAAVDCFLQTADAMQAMHSSGFVHCDLKPNNILINYDGQIKIIDLGQACPMGTAKQRIQGTPDYIAPEQVKCKPVTQRTDIFNFGATFYWVLTSRKLPTLFTLQKGENSFLLDDQIAAPHTLVPQVPEPLSNLIMECVRTNPLKRPATMGEILVRLQIMQHAVGLPVWQDAIVA